MVARIWVFMVMCYRGEWQLGNDTVVADTVVLRIQSRVTAKVESAPRLQDHLARWLSTVSDQFHHSDTDTGF